MSADQAREEVSIAGSPLTSARSMLTSVSRGEAEPPPQTAGGAVASAATKGDLMGIMDDAKDAAENATDKMKDAWDDATERAGDKIDEMKADAKAKKAETERDAVHAKNDVKENLRDDD